jgi:hypothetical protein
MASENLTLGKGEVYFGKFKTGTQVVEGYRLLGNCPEFTLNMETDELEHFSSMSGLREKDESVVIERRLGGTINCEDIRPDNLALFFMGEASTLTATSQTGVVNTFTDVKKGMMYQLGVTPTNPSGARKVASVVVEVGVTAKTLGTDYTLDADLGTITILPGGTILDGDDVEVTFNITASTRQRILSGDEQIEGALKFISRSPIGAKIDYLLPWVKIRSNGDVSLITDEWMSLPFTIEALVLGDLKLLYADGRAIV